jgi:hypothetical protein
MFRRLLINQTKNIDLKGFNKQIQAKIKQKKPSFLIAFLNISVMIILSSALKR